MELQKGPKAGARDGLPAFGVSAALLTLVFTLLAALTSLCALSRFPNSADEYNFLLQAEAFTRGRIWNPAAPLHESFFFLAQTTLKAGRWTVAYYPAWGLTLAAALSAHIPSWLVNPLFGLIAFPAFSAFALLHYERKTVLLSLFTLTFTPFMVFNFASYFSHPSCFTHIILAFLCGALYGKNPRCSYLLIAAGFFAGLAALTRWYTAFWVFLPALAARAGERRGGAKKECLLWAAGFLPCLAAYFVWNRLLTGSALTDGALAWSWRPETIAFGEFRNFGPREFFVVLSDHLIRLVRWSNIGILAAYAAGLIFRKKRTAVDWVPLSLAAGYLFYGATGGNQYGPRYYFEGYPFMVLSAVDLLFTARSQNLKGRLTPALLWIVFWAGFTVMLGRIPGIVREEHRVVQERRDVYVLTADMKIDNAVVFLASGTGVERPMPVWDLVRNGIDMAGGILYASDRGAENAKLKAFFPGRKAYRYERIPSAARGKLTEIG